MAARTCLLCGKPLSRIWADKGEEFCSREHRNQYRLRAGMGRLMEANKVASVLRRREIPKQIPVGDLRSPGPASPRGFWETLRRPPAELAIRHAKLAGRPKMLAPSRFVAASPRAAGPAESRDLPKTMPFAGPPPRAPQFSLRMPAHVMAAPAAPPRPYRGAKAEPQTPAIRWRGTGKPSIGALLARVDSRSAAPMPGARPARRVAAPSLGRALRVSTAAGFRLSVREFPAPRFAAPEVQGLPRPGARRMSAAAPQGVPAGVREIGITPAAMRTPPPPGPDFESRFRWPGAFEISLEFRNAANARRPLAVPFGPPEESAKERSK